MFQATNEGIDTILDFAFGVDDVAISAAAFGGGLLAGQPLAASQFVSGTAPAANAANGQFLYNTSNGALWSDGDGIGANAAVQLATLTGAPVFTQRRLLLTLCEADGPP